MFSQDWQASARRYGITIDRDVRIPVAEGITLDADIFRPDASGRFPAILAVHAYSKAEQSMEMLPIGFDFTRGSLEAGDYNFYARRGYVFAIVNIRGTGKSDGLFGNYDPGSIKDIYQVIEWLAAQPWCDGNVGMNGVSYFSIIAKFVAALKPPHLKALFSPYGWTDAYRDRYYHGGILSYGFLTQWIGQHGARMRFENALRKEWGDERYDAAIKAALADPEIAAVPQLAAALREPDKGPHSVVCSILLNALDGPYYRERTLDYDAVAELPAYFGADWSMFGLHLPGDLRSYENWKGPKRLTIGPPIYLDRPVYQYAFESLRWFDHWLKGVDTGIMDEPPVQLFIEGTGEWKSAESWPVPGTRWTPFYLHARGLLSEHEFWPNEGFTTFEDSPFGHGAAEFWTPPMVEATELCGPVVLNLYGSTTDTEVLWFVSLLHRDAAGNERLLTRGWLRGSQRRLNEKKSRPWQPCHAHDRREPLSPNEVYEFAIEVRPVGILLKPGERLGLRVKCADNDPPTVAPERVAIGHLTRPNAAHVSVHHNAEHPSHLLLPVTRGNRIGTFISGGKLPPLPKP